jgi:hypothetical protein
VFDGRPAWNSCIDDPLHRSGHHLFLKRTSIQTSSTIKYPPLSYPTSFIPTASKPLRHGRTDTATQLPRLPPCPSRNSCKIPPTAETTSRWDKHAYKRKGRGIRLLWVPRMRAALRQRAMVTGTIHNKQPASASISHHKAVTHEP